MRAKNTATEFPLNSAQLFELDMGPKSTSAFRDEDELREAWLANRERMMEKYVWRTHDAGWRPEAYWYFEAGGDPALADAANWRDDDAVQARRLRWLLEHDAFLPGELDRMRRRAKRDPLGYAAGAWKVIEEARR